ncbi:dihydrofolate reductase family protein [Psychromarinibacter sp. C21-152]|uniref:Dihydrofolate reductase family protein n=1 Tax=Psychromarinibacter sediminicola TaxID=3033385 RepID=A0AAE3TB50_9RHOB|nr:dihydrofolate reductase family protein [Psychromarinibacter sediminicola]MDF0602305.1 dihydrofolate reductase family protein [Psychromarinibacter sediminicola]
MTTGHATGHVFIAVSLDGYIARPDGGIDWLDAGPPAPEDEDFGYAAFVARMDGLVMGRESFETVLGFGDWPYEMPVVVLSSTLTEGDIPARLRGRVLLMSGEPAAVMEQLAGRGWARVYIDGGETIRRFLRAGYIAEMILTRLPVLIGAGRPLFGALAQDLWLEHAGTESFANGFVQSRYAVPVPRS